LRPVSLHSPLLVETTSHSFPKKFVMPNFEYYFEAIDPIQHLR